uniref:CNDH2_N domain-containing protein n=1 Tax=Angiostrongylus cantonensis TaxID=6313 RepID=A0A0K0D5K2_ANGCA
MAEQFLESDTAEDFEGAGHRCAFLHRPATSLGKNFKTNISKELDDCCLSLGEITGNDQLGIDNPHRFNFDEAAMLIQRFAFVFGTKVDYLHSQAMHFLETLPPQKTKKTKKIVQEDDERFVVENEAVIDPCDFLDQGLLKACNVESLCSVHAKQLLEDQDCVDVAFAFGENEETGAVTYSVGHRVEVVCKMDDFRMICRFVNSRDSMLKGVLLLHLGHEQVIDDFASDTFVLLWQPHLLSPNENAKRPTVPQEGLVLNFHNQPAGYGRSHLKVELLAVIVDMYRVLWKRVDGGAMRDEKVGFEILAKGDFGCCDGHFYAGGALTLPLPSSSRNIRQLEPQASSERLSFFWDSNESETIENKAERILLDSLDPFQLVHWNVKPVGWDD